MDEVNNALREEIYLGAKNITDYLKKQRELVMAGMEQNINVDDEISKYTSAIKDAQIISAKLQRKPEKKSEKSEGKDKAAKEKRLSYSTRKYLTKTNESK